MQYTASLVPRTFPTLPAPPRTDISRHIIYADAQQALHSYAMAQKRASVIAVPNPATKTNETKLRLGKDEVDILEHEFKKNPNPTTQTKRHLAEDMRVDLARINVL
jgi:hypothetical protein